MLVSIPPKYAASQVVGYMKEKRAIHIAAVAKHAGERFLAHGYFVSTVGAMRRQCASTSNTRRKKTSGWTS